MNLFGKSVGGLFKNGIKGGRQLFSSGVDVLKKVAPVGSVIATSLGHPEIAAGLMTAAKYGDQIKQLL
jgi:hypothetical protein